MSTVSYDSRAVTIDGRRTLTLSGAIHYPRSTPEQWPALMRRSRAAGLNTVETYVFWNLHERQRGVLDFSGRLDLPLFCRTAQEQGLNVILRIGPYICAETNFGGLPPWLREVPGLVVRTHNEPFMREMERWVRALCEVLRPQFAPQGGPIVLAQMENEYNNIAKYYGDDGQRYLQWCVDMAASLNLGVPLVMCAGGAPGSIETINAFYGHEQLADHFRKHPDQPALWTEAYPGWYDTWGYPHHTRSIADMAYGAARFFAGGGTGINYYMWHGGTNFARESMYLQTASYDFDAPLDEYGLETTKSRHLGRLHALLAANAEALLGRAVPEPACLADDVCVYRYGAADGSLAFLCSDAKEGAADVAWEGRSYRLAPRSVQAVRGGEVLFDSASVAARSRVRRGFKALARSVGPWTCAPEPMPAKRLNGAAVTARRPVEQLRLTHDESDYCWYGADLVVPRGGPGEGTLELRGAADLVHVFVDGKLCATTPAPLVENRTLKGNQGFTQRFSLRLAPGRHRLELLCCALGLIKGDWMLGFQNMVHERKGLWGDARWNGRPVAGPWTMTPALFGEQAAFCAAGGALLRWRRPERGAGCPLTWWRAEFRAPTGRAPLALDLDGMGKGLVWVNGRCLSRYWLVPAREYNPISPRELAGPAAEAVPTQRYYHVPRAWLRERNTLVLFEEQGGDPRRVALCARQ